MSIYRDRALTRAAARLQESRERAARGGGPDTAPPMKPTDPLQGVVFATDRAEEVARELGLGWLAFARSDRTPSSAKGWTTADVRTIHQESADAASG